MFAAAAVLGGFAVFIELWIALIHLPIVIWSAAINFAGKTCPLTPMEKRFRAAGGGVAYEGGFIQHYIGGVVYPKGMPRRLEITAGVSVLAWNAALYTVILLLR